MKHALPRLLLAATALAALLSACGGSGTATTQVPPKVPVLDNLSATRTAGLLGFGAQRPMPDDPGGNPGGIAPPGSPPAARHPRMLVLDSANGQATVCQRKGAVLVCADIAAPLPPGTDVHLVNLPDGTHVVTYTRSPGTSGVPDPDGNARQRFQAAFNGAARAVLAYGSNVRAGGRDRQMKCENEDCVEDSDGIPSVDVPGGGGGGGGWGGGGGGYDGGGGGGGGTGGDAGQPPMQVVKVPGVPDPVDSIPRVVVTGHYDPDIPLLPARDPQYDLAALDDTCVHGPIASVCVVGKRPPLPPTERLPNGRMPILPQWACNLWKFLCTGGQIQRTNDDLPPDDPPGEDREKFQRCMVKVRSKLDYCAAMKEILDIDTFAACLDQVGDMMDDCAARYGPAQ